MRRTVLQANFGAAKPRLEEGQTAVEGNMIPAVADAVEKVLPHTCPNCPASACLVAAIRGLR